MHTVQELPQLFKILLIRRNRENNFGKPKDMKISFNTNVNTKLSLLLEQPTGRV